LVLATGSAAAASMENDPDSTPVAVFNAFADAVDARDLDRAEALLADSVTIADERGEYVGNEGRDWLVRNFNDGIHLRLVRVSRIDTDERGTPGYTTWWMSFTVALSWDLERKLGVAPHTREASAIVQGSFVHSLRIEPLGWLAEPLTAAHGSSTASPGEPRSPPPWSLLVMAGSVAVLGVVARRLRVHTEPRLSGESAQAGIMLHALREATVRSRAARLASPAWKCDEVGYDAVADQVDPL